MAKLVEQRLDGGHAEPGAAAGCEVADEGHQRLLVGAIGQPSAVDQRVLQPGALHLAVPASIWPPSFRIHCGHTEQSGVSARISAL